jgi:hypothetical protein
LGGTISRRERKKLHIQVPDITSPALLKSAEGKLLEIGEAVVSIENRSVDFHSEFVHLFKMDTPLKIVLTKDGEETQCFDGRVYLSTQTMLRLVEVSDQVLPGAKMAYLCEVDMPGTLTALISEEVAEGFMNLQRRQVTRQQSFVVRIHALSMACVYFTCEQRLEKGQYVQLDLPVADAEGLLLEIERAYDFGQTTRNYHCRIREMINPARVSLDDYVADLCKAQFKLF